MSKIETITIDVDQNLYKNFRKLAAIKYGNNKKCIEKAIDSAMKIWMEMQESENMDIRAIEELRKGYNLGGFRYKSRNEFHER